MASRGNTKLTDCTVLMYPSVVCLIRGLKVSHDSKFRVQISVESWTFELSEYEALVASSVSP